MKEWLPVVFYATLFCILIRALRLPEKTGLQISWLIVFFILRVACGIFYGWLHDHLYGNVDTWSNFNDSETIYSALPAQPCAYLQLVFGINIPPPSGAIASYAYAMTCWNQPDTYFMVRLQALSDFFTFANYNANVVIYNFLIFLGLIQLYLFFREFIPSKQRLLLILIFLLPNILFWSSGLAKDGFALAAMGFLASGFQHQFLNTVQRKFFPFLNMVIGIWLLAVLRPYVLFLMLPFFAALYFSEKNKNSTVFIFMICLLFFTVLGLLPDLFSSFGILHLITAKQQQFSTIAAGNSAIHLTGIANSFFLFVKAIPFSILNVLFNPVPTSSGDWQQVLLFIQNIFLLAAYLFCFLYRKKKLTEEEVQLVCFCGLLSFCWIIIIGESIPNFGAIARYKMPVELLLMIASVTLLDEKKLSLEFMMIKAKEMKLK